MNILIYDNTVYFNVGFADIDGAPIAADECYNAPSLYISQGAEVLFTLGYDGEKVVTLDQICSSPVREGAGFNPDYGVLGSNYTNDDSVKLFPRGCEEFVRELQAEMKSRTGRDVEVLVYGDGAFKDPVCGIWELADPVVSPGFTDGLVGLPKEIKFKYVADNAEGKDPAKAVEEAIRAKSRLDRFGHSTLGTTPRRLTDLIGSLCDLTSGSGDKGTPVVYIQGYFDSYLDD